MWLKQACDQSKRVGEGGRKSLPLAEADATSHLVAGKLHNWEHKKSAVQPLQKAKEISNEPVSLKDALPPFFLFLLDDRKSSLSDKILSASRFFLRKKISRICSLSWNKEHDQTMSRVANLVATA